MIRLGGSRKVGKQRDQCKLKHGERYMYEHSEVRRREEDSEQTITSYEEEEEGRLAATLSLPSHKRTQTLSADTTVNT